VLNCSPWELEEQEVYWVEAALAMERIEAEAETEIQARYRQNPEYA